MDRKPILFATLLVLTACTPADRDDSEAAASPTDQAPAAPVEPAAPPQPKPAPAEPAPVSDGPSFAGFGAMRLGSGVDEMTQAWGGELTRVGGEDDVCYYLTPKWVKTVSELAFMIENGTFVRYDVGNAKQTAPGGGKVGMAADEIRGLYAGRIEEMPHKYTEGAKYLVVSPEDGAQTRLVFETDAQGKVTAWRIGLPPQVHYVEGCA